MTSASESAPSGSDPATRERILTAGMRAVTQFGRTKTTLQDVATAAGVSRATIYRYFKDSDALFRSIRKHEEDRDAALFAGNASTTECLEDAIAALAELRVATELRYRTRAHLEAGDEGLAVYIALRSHRERARIAGLIRPYVERAERAGELRGGVSCDDAVDWIAFTLSQAHSLDSGRAPQGEDEAVVIGRWLARMCCQGISATRRQR